MPGLHAYRQTGDNNRDLAGLTLPATLHWPKMEVLVCTTTEASLKLEVHAGLAWFVGHFVDQPVLPGVVQTHWAGLLALELFTQNSSLQFSQLRKVKFNAVVRPGQHLQLKLKWQTERQQCAFSYLDQGGKAVSSGTVCFASPKTSAAP